MHVRRSSCYHVWSKNANNKYDNLLKHAHKKNNAKKTFFLTLVYHKSLYVQMSYDIKNVKKKKTII